MRYVYVLLIVGVLIGGMGYWVIRDRASREPGKRSLWDARLAALEPILGKYDSDHILTSMLPFHLGGDADVLTFRKHLDGVAYVTASLIGDDRSKPGRIGQYELMICLREDNDWAPELVSWLAKYTREAVLNPGETMEISPGLPQPTSLSHLLFVEYARVTVEGKQAGILLCLGITPDEYECLHERGFDTLLDRLKASNVYPFTDLSRDSVPCGP